MIGETNNAPSDDYDDIPDPQLSYSMHIDAEQMHLLKTIRNIDKISSPKVPSSPATIQNGKPIIYNIDEHNVIKHSGSFDSLDPIDTDENKTQYVKSCILSSDSDELPELI